jgi:Cu(I)/Ag(I) efflux system membrane fusion protein
MFVNAIIRVPLVTGIVIPVTAVIDTGKRQVAWVETAPGMFEPRDVQVGERVEDKLQILSGLNAGDKVAVSGGYLIDSEAQLQSGTGEKKAGASNQGPGTGTGGHQGHNAPVPATKTPAKKGPLKMDDMKM